MRFLHDLPMRRKLTVVTMSTSGAALLLAGLVFLGYQRAESRRNLLDDLRRMAVLVGDNSAAALTFGDPSSAAQTLGALDAHTAILIGAVYDSTGSLFATHRGALAPPSTAAPLLGRDGFRFGPDDLELFHPIDLAGERAGTVFLRASLGEVRSELLRTGLVVGVVLAAASILAFLLSARLQSAVSGPIVQLASVAGAVARDKDYSLRATKVGTDEMGRLVDGFNEMLGEIQSRDCALQEARDQLEVRVRERTRELQEEIAERKRAEAELERIHRELLVASREAGMAEIASNVLHNVGNVLNSVNVSAEVVAESLRQARLAGLLQVVGLLHEHEHDLGDFLTKDPGGSRIPAYLSELSARLAGDRAKGLVELELLRRSIDHIKEIVAMQQSYARVAGVVERVAVADLIQDSLRINAGALARHGVEVVRELEPAPPVSVDKHRVLQILVNLLRNAKYACEESGRADKKVTVKVTNGDDRIRIAVVDNGVGIPPENLTRIFQHGFTTRASGHGFGLHASAIAAQEMGGALVAASAGPGTGACFTLELPTPPRSPES